MWYAVIAPGVERVTDNWKDVERIKYLYPYPKWSKWSTTEAAEAWIKRNRYAHPIQMLKNYGDTFKEFAVHVEYKIGVHSVYYKITTSDTGTLYLPKQDENTLVEYEGNVIRIRVENYVLSNETIAGHMSALYTILAMLGPVIDVDLTIDYYCILYCLTFYSQNKNRSVALLRDTIANRLGATAYTYGGYENVRE